VVQLSEIMSLTVDWRPRNKIRSNCPNKGESKESKNEVWLLAKVSSTPKTNVNTLGYISKRVKSRLKITVQLVFSKSVIMGSLYISNTPKLV